jgi:hypothetical protein
VFGYHERGKRLERVGAILESSPRSLFLRYAAGGDSAEFIKKLVSHTFDHGSRDCVVRFGARIASFVLGPVKAPLPAMVACLAGAMGRRNRPLRTLIQYQLTGKETQRRPRVDRD